MLVSEAIQSGHRVQCPERSTSNRCAFPGNLLFLNSITFLPNYDWIPDRFYPKVRYCWRIQGRGTRAYLSPRQGSTRAHPALHRHSRPYGYGRHFANNIRFVVEPCQIRGVDTTASFLVYLKYSCYCRSTRSTMFKNYGAIIMSKNIGRAMTILSCLLILKE